MQPIPATERLIWVNLITTEPCSPEPWIHGNWIREIIPFYGRKIQVSELLQFTQISK